MRVAAIIALLLVTSTVVSADAGFDNLQVDRTSCTLVHSGSISKEAVWTGEKKYGMCSVKVNTSTFSQKYTYCALSGILGTESGRVMCEFGYVDASKQRVLFMSSGDNLCQFVCMRRR